jgi:bifunctional non-homologous end joining protein LigD
MFEAACKLGLEVIVSKKLDAPYRSGPSKAWIKVKNPKAPVAARTIDGWSNEIFNRRPNSARILSRLY